MPRANRHMVDGHIYHLTQRCHDRRFLLRFAKDRAVYREWLRKGARRYRVPVYAYCITSNHVHLVVHVVNREAVAHLMDLVSGATARNFNRRKGRSGAFWENPYHATAVESGLHLWRCLRYVDMNMVRAGVVDHPAEWPWCGYDELMGERHRYRILDSERLMQSLDGVTVNAFRKAYGAGIDQHLAQRKFTREAMWSDALAVGSRAFVERVAAATPRVRLDYAQLTGERDAETWCVRERAGSPYLAKTLGKKAT